LSVEAGARDIRIESAHGGGSKPSGEGPKDLGLTEADLETVRLLADFHRLLAAELPPQSEIRGLVLRCAGHWSRLGAIPRNGLAEAEPRDRS
jgi:hypothetical protein